MPNSANDIVLHLRQLIDSGRYHYGERLPPERVLSQEYQVARGTIREALRNLESMGYVLRKHGSGTYVQHETKPLPSVAETTRPLELIDARYALEPHLVRLAVLHATAHDLGAVEAHLQKMENCGNDLMVFADTDERFHLALAASAHNPLIFWMMERVHAVRAHAQWARMRTLTLSLPIIHLYNRQHRAIFNAIQRRNADEASRAMKDHIDTARRTLVELAN